MLHVQYVLQWNHGNRDVSKRQYHEDARLLIFSFSFDYHKAGLCCYMALQHGPVNPALNLI